MKNQTYQNHVRYYPFHHFVITPLTIAFLVWTIWRADFSTSELTESSLYHILLGIIVVLVPFLARIYALKLQNRIILSEMRMRYFQLTGKFLDPLEAKLKLSQLIALRFASDEELISLMEKAASTKMSPQEIKKAIQNWKGDYRRV